MDVTDKANELLQKFGMGGHKPGSGSAAALQGMLSAQLIRTVIELTQDENHRQNYEKWLTELSIIKTKIEDDLYPELLELFRKDSIQFERVIDARKARNKEKNWSKKKKLIKKALKELKPATEIPLKIGKLCAELSINATKTFDHGFKSARGDTGVAIDSAVSALAGCISIIDLNLTSFENDNWTKKVQADTNELRKAYESLKAEAYKRNKTLESEANKKLNFSIEIQTLLKEVKSASTISNYKIELLVTRLQRSLWINKEGLWKFTKLENPIDVIKPDKVLKELGYKYEEALFLENFNDRGKSIQTAGVINGKTKEVSISKNFDLNIINFTKAHELGHAILHQDMSLHRDRPMDGSKITSPRNKEEYQADKFASFFLMPKKQVIEMFQERFSTKKFIIEENTVFHLNENSIDNFRKKCKDQRGLSRILAQVSFYNRKPFITLAEHFKVSVEAMAIRIEELKLIEF